jgi:hypothetical protein
MSLTKEQQPPQNPAAASADGLMAMAARVTAAVARTASLFLRAALDGAYRAALAQPADDQPPISLAAIAAIVPHRKQAETGGLRAPAVSKTRAQQARQRWLEQSGGLTPSPRALEARALIARLADRRGAVIEGTSRLAFSVTCEPRVGACEFIPLDTETVRSLAYDLAKQNKKRRLEQQQQQQQLHEAPSSGGGAAAAAAADVQHHHQQTPAAGGTPATATADDATAAAAGMPPPPSPATQDQRQQQQQPNLWADWGQLFQVANLSRGARRERADGSVSGSAFAGRITTDGTSAKVQVQRRIRRATDADAKAANVGRTRPEDFGKRRAKDAPVIDKRVAAVKRQGPSTSVAAGAGVANTNASPPPAPAAPACADPTGGASAKPQTAVVPAAAAAGADPRCLPFAPNDRVPTRLYNELLQRGLYDTNSPPPATDLEQWRQIFAAANVRVVGIDPGQRKFIAAFTLTHTAFGKAEPDSPTAAEWRKARIWHKATCQWHNETGSARQAARQRRIGRAYPYEKAVLAAIPSAAVASPEAYERYALYRCSNAVWRAAAPLHRTNGHAAHHLRYCGLRERALHRLVLNVAFGERGPGGRFAPPRRERAAGGGALAAVSTPPTIAVLGWGDSSIGAGSSISRGQMAPNRFAQRWIAANYGPPRHAVDGQQPRMVFVVLIDEYRTSKVCSSCWRVPANVVHLKLCDADGRVRQHTRLFLCSHCHNAVRDRDASSSKAMTVRTVTVLDPRASRRGLGEFERPDAVDDDADGGYRHRAEAVREFASRHAEAVRAAVVSGEAHLFCFFSPVSFLFLHTNTQSPKKISHTFSNPQPT